jgi:hypothetical protein
VRVIQVYIPASAAVAGIQVNGVLPTGTILQLTRASTSELHNKLQDKSYEHCFSILGVMASNECIEGLFDKLERTFKSRFDQIDFNLSDVKDKHEKLDRKIHKPREFKRDGNKDQHSFNTGLFDFYADAKMAMLQNNPTKAIDIMDKGMDEIKKRQKLIVIADTYGWEVVKEYLGCDMASDSDDDTKIRRALSSYDRKKKATATKEFNKKKSSRGKGSNDRYNSRNQDSRSYGRRSPFRDNRGGGYGRSDGTCHTCGGHGHWSSECGSRKKPSYDKKA